MSSNQNLILEKYGDGNKEDGRSHSSRTSGLEFYYTKHHLDGYITKKDKVLEIGCGTGYYGLYYSDKCKEYVGIDIVPSHVEIFSEKIKSGNITNVSCAVGDATNLKNIKDDSFDVVLCLGPVYHLPLCECEEVFSECRRVCKKGGIVAFAYINKIGLYAGGCVHDDFREFYPNANANEYVLEKNTDDMYPGIFYFLTPEDIETVASKFGFKKIKNLGTDFMVTRKIVDDMSDEKFEIMKPLYDYMTSYESCTGMSNHALLICKNNKMNIDI